MTDLTLALNAFRPVTAPAIPEAGLRARIDGLQARMRHEGVKAVWLDA